MAKIRIWDLPLRLFHWVLTLLIVAAVITQKIGGTAMEWHFRCGYAALTLIAFRVLWGLVGSRYARFASFIWSPAAMLAYLKGLPGTARQYAGHNPLGSLSVITLLGIVAVQALSGLFSNDDIAYDGPWVKFISKEMSDRITWFHKDVSGNLIYALIGLHIAAIAFYYFRKKENLITPMLTGDKEIAADTPPSSDSLRMRLLALLLLGICSGVMYWLLNL
jgi:cytochrome b